MSNVPGVSTSTAPGPASEGSDPTAPASRARRRPVAGLVVWVVAMLVVAAGAGLVWAWLAEPPGWVVTPQGGLLLSEEASTAQIGVELLFVALGLGSSFVVAALGAWRLWTAGWVVVPVAGVTALLGSLVAWRLGVLVGPPGIDDVSGTVAPGDTVSAALAVDSWGAFLAWPVAALLAVVLVVWVSDRPRRATGADDLGPGADVSG